MTKRRSSIRGRGAEILLGEPLPTPIKPRGPDRAPTETEAPRAVPVAEPAVDAAGEPSPPPSEPGQLLNEVELAALFEEARAGEPAPEEEEERWSIPSPEPPPAHEASVPASEGTSKRRGLPEEAVIHEPPPPETSDVTSGVLPPRPAHPFLDEAQGIATHVDVQEPEGRTEPLELPDRELTEEEKQKILAYLGGARLQELESEIDGMYEEVRSQLGENEAIATDCFNSLLKARDILVRCDAAKIPQAEYYIEQVRARLMRAAESEAGAKKYAWRIAGWGLLWFAIYITVLVLFNFSWVREALMPMAIGSSPVDMEIFVPAMIWGGIGGVVCVFYSLFKHVGQRDFDTHYNLSYVGKPFLGVILGATVYMIVHMLLLTLGIMPARVQRVEGVNTIAVVPWVIYLLAWACGFKENLIFDLVNRVMKRIFSREEAAQPVPPATPPEPAA